MPADSKETKLGSSNEEASPSAGKDTGVVLVPCLCIPTAISGSVDIYEVSVCHCHCPLVMTDEFSVRVTKITSSLPFYF